MHKWIAMCLLSSCTFGALAQTVAPERMPSDAQMRMQIERVLDERYPADAPGVTVLVARGDAVLYRGARGMADIGKHEPMRADHVLRIGSVTKQFAAAALLKLVEQKKLSLDDTLDRFMPDYPNARAITVRMLLNHTSGIRSYTDVPGRMDEPIRQAMTTAQLIDSFKREPIEFAPGKGWKYNNSGYVLVGAVIEQVTGKPWHASLRELLFKPLQLAHTAYGDTSVHPIVNHTQGYRYDDGRWQIAPGIHMSQPHAAGALVSTVDDLWRWNLALHRGKVLGDAQYRQMTTPEGAAIAAHYGDGIERGTLRGQTMLEHGGGIHGFASDLLYLPDSGVSVAVLSNSDSRPPTMTEPALLARELAAIAIGKPYPPKHAITIGDATLREYEGVYRIDPRQARVVRVIDGALTSQRTGGSVQRLLPVARDAFLFEQGYSRMTFERNAAGKVIAMRMFAEDEGDGERVTRSDEPLPVERESVSLTAEQIQRVLGTYATGPATLHVFLQHGALKTQLVGQPAFDLFAASPDRFFLKVVDAELEFTPGPAKAAALTLHQNGQSIRFERIADAPHLQE